MATRGGIVQTITRDERTVRLPGRERSWEEMKRKRICYGFLFIALILVFSSCHPRQVADIKPNMTKEDVVSLWGTTNLITYNTVQGKSVETWEYHFATSNSICWVTFVQDRVTNTQCKPRPSYYYAYPYRYYYPYPYGYYYPYYYPYGP